MFQWISLVAFLPGFVALVYNELFAANIFFALGILIFFSGYFIKNFFVTERPTEFKHALLIVGLIWIIAPFISSIPFVLIAKQSPLNGLFESMAAWTTTGLSIFTKFEELPHSILFSRSLMQWFGGVGVVLAALGGIFRTGGKAFFAEFSSVSEERIRPNILHTVKSIWSIYIAYTIAGIIAFILAGMPIFDSITQTFSGIATGGMAVRSGSIGAYNSIWIELVSIFIMIVGATSFAAHWMLFRKNFKGFISFQFKLLLSIIAVATTILLLFHPLRSAAFQVISAATTTGFSTASVADFPEFSKFILITLMLVGGAAGSTAGGIKLIRGGICFKEIWWQIRRFLTPEIAIKRKIGRVSLKERHVRIVMIFIIIYFLFFLTGTGTLILLGYKPINSAFDSLSALSLVGLSTGIAGPALQTIGKIVLIINMYVGRVEIWAALSILGAIFIRK